MTAHDLDLVNRQNVCAIVVLYRPEQRAMSLVRALAGTCGRVHVLDNSESGPYLDVPHQSNVCLTRFGTNIGLARAYNIALGEACSLKFEFAVFLDQDTEVTENFAVEAIREYALAKQNLSTMNVLLGLRSGRTGEPSGEVDMTIGSGLFVRVADAFQIGLFDESRFVDGVDEEFCLRARSRGWRIFMSERTLLHHEIGETNLVLGCFRVFNYSPQRIEFQLRHTRRLAVEYIFTFPLYVTKKILWQFKSVLMMVVFRRGRRVTLAAALRGIFTD